MGYTMKGSPFKRNFGVSPMRQQPLTKWQKASRQREADLETTSNEKRTNHPDYEDHNYRANKTKVFGPKKKGDNYDSANEWTNANNILIDNAPNPNRKAEAKASSEKAIKYAEGERKNRAYNKSRSNHIKRTQEINQSGKGFGGKIKKTKKSGWLGLPDMGVTEFLGMNKKRKQ